MKSAKYICRKTNCNILVPTSGYCSVHKTEHDNRFKGLRKASGSRSFYSSSRWTQTSKRFRELNPLCADHYKQGIVVKGDLVDHVIERNDLIAKGESPFDFNFLQTLCHGCHNRKLSVRNQAVVRR